VSQSQGSHRAVRGGRGTRVRTAPPPKVPEQGYDTGAGRASRPAPYGAPHARPQGPPYRQEYGQEYGQERPREYGQAQVPPYASEFASFTRHERGPLDTYRPAYEAATAGPADGSRLAARRAERARRAAERPETLRRLLPQALVVAFLAGGTSAFVAHDKAVVVSIDGRPRTLHTFADDVGELLDEEGLKAGEHDIVAPGRRQPLADGEQVAVRYGRPLALTLDGSRRRVWTTARTVEGALRQLGVRAEGAFLSASRSAHIGRTGMALDIRTERGVTFLSDGRERTVRTNAATVRDALADADLDLEGLDTTSVPLESFPRDGQTITVMRITGSEKVKEERTAFRTERQADPGLNRGTEIVAQAGRPGVRRVTYRLRTVNGVREKPRRIAVEVLRHPRKQIIRVGTRPLPRSVAGADHLDWAALAHCESGGRPRAVDASGNYGGLYQFDTRTWHDLGGDGRPQDAPPAEQTFRAKKLYVSQGASPWPLCGRKLAR